MSCNIEQTVHNCGQSTAPGEVMGLEDLLYFHSSALLLKQQQLGSDLTPFLAPLMLPKRYVMDVLGH